MAYTSIVVEGALFPPDLLDRIAAGEIDGQRAEDFGLARGSRLSDEIQSTFSDVRAYWEAFQRRLGRSRESATTVTREAWVVPLLERLGFEPKYQGNAEAGGDSFAISHRLLAGDDGPPLSVIAAGQDLDRRVEGSRRNPHAAMQEYLNRSDHVWGFLTNGEQLRLTRDAARLSRPTYLEVNLRAMIEANLYSEFVLFYRLLHRSRWPASIIDAPKSILESYYQQGIDEGSRVREHLRDGVEHALRGLGTAFVSNTDNEMLRSRLRQGILLPADFYRQLLRLVYRVLFLMVIEERRLVFPPGEGESTLHDVYSRYYSLTTLRQRAEIPHHGDTNRDLWQGLLRTFELFREEAKASALGLAPMNGELFSREACQDLEEAECANAPLLDAMIQLSTFIPASGSTRRRVNYAGLDVEELGSVYEGLLDYRPRTVVEGVPTFELIAGSDRRQTGSYYTSPELVKELVEATLAPVIAECSGSSRAATDEMLLAIRICDLASGSGHFLLEAARRLAREVARARSREEEPTPVAFRAALRDVIRSCIYAVDKNPLAVDLCKVALWIEGHSEGMPLSFLDHHVKYGDSLVGLAPGIDIDEGIPSEAYHRSESANRSRARVLRQQNEAERKSGQLTLAVASHAQLSDLAESFGGIADLLDDSVSSVAEKGRRYLAARAKGGSWWTQETAAHFWTAAFFANPLGGPVPTTGSLRSFRADPSRFDGDGVISAVWALAEDSRYGFFHWPLEFPEVFSAGGFDVVLSNPPFMGGLNISTNFGDLYRNYLASTFSPMAGRTDLCATFLRRAFDVLKPRGRLGMVVTKTINEGDTRESGLAIVVRTGGSITFARRFIKWPGSANVEVNLLGISKHVSHGQRQLDGMAVAYISSRLDDQSEHEPKRLAANQGRAFAGALVVSIDGFTLSPAEAQKLIQRDRRNSDCLFPFLNGEDLNSRSDQSASRWIIQFDERSEQDARSYPDLWRIVDQRVRPQRIQMDAAKYGRAVREWWKYVINPRELNAVARDHRRLLVRAATSELHMMAFVPGSQVFLQAVYVFAFDDDYSFAVLQSNVHEAWVRRYATRLRTDVRYTLSDCFATFPMLAQPAVTLRARASAVGNEYNTSRGSAMLRRGLGLTKTYNLCHDEGCLDSDLVELRRLHSAMDRAVLACYGWHDIDPGHGFHVDDRGRARFTISPGARVEILNRLLTLNQQTAGQQQEAKTDAGRRGKHGQT